MIKKKRGGRSPRFADLALFARNWLATCSVADHAFALCGDSDISPARDAILGLRHGTLPRVFNHGSSFFLNSMPLDPFSKKVNPSKFCSLNHCFALSGSGNH